MNIGIDIDDTISNTFETGMKYAEEFTKEYCNREYTDIEKRLGSIKSHRHWQGIFEWNLEEDQEFFKRYYEKIIREVKPKEGVCEILNKLSIKNNLIFITARFETEGNKIENLTKNWLNENNIKFNKLYLRKDKDEVCKENNIQIFVDDSYENCKLVQCENTIAYLMDNMLNRNINDKDIERVYSWDDLYKRIVEWEEK